MSLFPDRPEEQIEVHDPKDRFILGLLEGKTWARRDDKRLDTPRSTIARRIGGLYRQGLAKRLRGGPK